MSSKSSSSSSSSYIAAIAASSNPGKFTAANPSNPLTAAVKAAWRLRGAAPMSSAALGVAATWHPRNEGVLAAYFALYDVADAAFLMLLMARAPTACGGAGASIRRAMRFAALRMRHSARSGAYPKARAHRSQWDVSGLWH